jgi:RNA polymerase sigma-70 factor (ECF subfamily)
MLKPTDDSELAAEATRGDREAFRRLVERHYDFIYRIAYRCLGSAADAEDIAQDVCVALATKLGGFRNRSRFTTWLASIVINRCRDHFRRRRSSQALVEKYGVLRQSAEADQADTKLRIAWLHEALQSLDPDLRETVVLVLAEDLSHAEAAAALGVAESTVSWRMHIARKRLRGRIGEDHD